jgi:hypothetical protein
MKREAAIGIGLRSDAVERIDALWICLEKAFLVVDADRPERSYRDVLDV